MFGFKLAVATVWGIEQARTSSDEPIAADGSVTYIVTDAEDNTIASGSCVAHASITGAYRFAFSTTSPTFQRGQAYCVSVEYTVDGGSPRVGHHHFFVT